MKEDKERDRDEVLSLVDASDGLHTVSREPGFFLRLHTLSFITM